MVQLRCICGTKFKNNLKLEQHQSKCKLTINQKLYHLQEYLYSVIDNSEIIIYKLKML